MRRSLQTLALRRGIVVLIACALPLSIGCASLAKLPEDSPAERNRKILMRICLGVGTFGFSEIPISKKQRRILQAREDYEAGVRFTNALREAQSLDSLIRHFGSNPGCTNSSDIETTCTWEFDSRTYAMQGAGSVVYFGQVGLSTTSARLVQTGGSAISVICSAPRNGSPRKPGSCNYATENGLFPENYLLTCRARDKVLCSPNAPYEPPKLRGQ